MASIAIDSPVHTPADEWAKETADALKPSPLIHENVKVMPTSSTVSTPGVEFPGAYPRDAVQEMANDSPYKMQDAFGQGIESAKQYLPAQETVNQHVETAKSYIPGQGDVQRVLGSAAETAKQYIPERVVAAVGGALPQGLVSANGTTPPTDDIDPIIVAKPAFQPQDSSTSFSSNPQITEDGISENLDSSSAPLSNTTGALGGAGNALGNAVGGVATTLDPTSQARPSKPAEPRISTTNIQEPYGEVSNTPDVGEKKPHIIEQDSGIQKTNLALANLQAGPDAKEVSGLQSSAPVPPPKPNNEDELVGRRTGEDVAHVNTQPTQDYVQNDRGLNAPPSMAMNKVGGNVNTTTVDHDRRGSIGSQASDESGSGKDEQSPKKGRGSRLVAKVKEKLHHKSN